MLDALNGRLQGVPFFQELLGRKLVIPQVRRFSFFI